MKLLFKNIIDDLNKIKIDDDIIKAKKITSNNDSFFLAINKNKDLIFIIRTDNEYLKNNNILIDSTKYLDIRYKVEINIDLDNNIIKSDFTTIKLLSSSNILSDFFITLCIEIINKLGDYPTIEQIRQVISGFKSLFQPLKSNQKKTELGVWGELFHIAFSNKIDYLIKAWHIRSSDTFDFNDGLEKLELKTTLNNSRIHRLSLNQVLKGIESKSNFCSIMTSQIDNGLSVSDLINKITESLNTEDSINFYKKLVKTCGDDLNNFDKKFDIKTAIVSRKYFDANIIPKINQNFIDNGVSNIKYDADFEGLSEINTSLINSKIIY